jgi:pimeloyl-ACP methyl ester carboxylesterase
MDVVDVQGLRIAYERAGRGEPLVLLHGFVGDGRATWAQQFEAFIDDHTVVVWDAPGTGGSTTPPATFRIDDFAGVLAAFLEALGIRRCHVAGLSFGGTLALALAATSPGSVASLTLLSAYAGWRGSLGPDAAAARLRTCEEAARLTPADFGAVMLPSMFSDGAPAAVADGFRASVEVFDPGGFLTMARACEEADLRGVLGNIVVPTLVLAGDADVRAPLPVAEEIAAGIPGARLVVLPAVGHVVTVEAPDAVTREMRAFLHGVPPLA